MIRFIFVSFILSFLFIQPIKAAQLGIFLGANQANFDWFTQAPLDEYILNGFGSAGGLSLSFNQYKRFGFRIAAINYLTNLSTISKSQGKTKTISGQSLITLATLDINFDFGTNRHSFGIGYGYEPLTSLNFGGTGTQPASTSASGLVLDGKDFWKNGWFDYVAIFVPHDNLNAYYSHYVFTLGIGYEF